LGPPKPGGRRQEGPNQPTKFMGWQFPAAPFGNERRGPPGTGGPIRGGGDKAITTWGIRVKNVTPPNKKIGVWVLVQPSAQNREPDKNDISTATRRGGGRNSAQQKARNGKNPPRLRASANIESAGLRTVLDEHLECFGR